MATELSKKRQKYNWAWYERESSDLMWHADWHVIRGLPMEKAPDRLLGRRVKARSGVRHIRQRRQRQLGKCGGACAQAR